MIDFAAHVLVAGGTVVAVSLAAWFFACAIGEALDTIREARDTAAEAEGRARLYPAPDLDARGAVVDVAPLLDRLSPLDRPVGMVGGDGWRNR